MRRVGAKQFEAAIGDGARGLKMMHLVRRKREQIIASRALVTPHDGAALHPRRRCNSREAQNCRPHVHQPNQAIGARARREAAQMAEFGRHIHDERHAHAGLINEAFAARRNAAVIGIEENDGVFVQPFGLEVAQEDIHPAVDVLDAFEVKSGIGAHCGQVGQMSRKLKFGGIEALRGEVAPSLQVEGAHAAHVSGVGVENGEKRLSRLAPGRIIGGLGAVFIPDGGGVGGRVVIGFRVVGAKVTRLAQRKRKEMVVGNRGVAAMPFAGISRGIGASDNRGARRAALRPRRPGALEEHAARRSCVQNRRFGVRVAVASELVRAGVLDGEPEDVGARATRGVLRSQARGEGERRRAARQTGQKFSSFHDLPFSIRGSLARRHRLQTRRHLPVILRGLAQQRLHLRGDGSEFGVAC